jgi:hypothetical protein
MKIKTFTYNKAFSYSAVTGLLLIITLFLIRSFQLQDPAQTRILIYAGSLILIILGFTVFKYLIPSIKRNSALELNEFSLIDHVRNREVYWNNIRGIRLINFFLNGGSGLAIDLIDKKIFISTLSTGQSFLCRMNNFSFGTPLVIPLQYISGNNNDIYEAVKYFYEKRKIKP